MPINNPILTIPTPRLSSLHKLLDCSKVQKGDVVLHIKSHLDITLIEVARTTRTQIMLEQAGDTQLRFNRSTGEQMYRSSSTLANLPDYIVPYVPVMDSFIEASNKLRAYQLVTE